MSSKGLKGFFSFYKPYKALFAADMICSAFVALLGLSLPMCVRYITKDILEAGLADATVPILYTAAVMLGIILLQTAFGIFQDYKGHDMGAKIERDMRSQLFAHYQKLSFGFYDNNKTGQLMSRITNDILNLAELYHHGPENFIIHGAQFIGSLVILLGINVKLTLLVCAFLPVIGVYSFFFYFKLQKSYEFNRRQIGNVNASVEENLSGIRVVKSFVGEKLEIDKFEKENDKFYRSRKDIYKREALHYTVVSTLLVNLITIAIVAGGAIWILSDSLDIADLISFLLYSSFLTSPIPKLAFMVQQYQQGFSGYRRFREIIDISPEIDDAEDATELRVTHGKVEFCNIDFRYDDKSDYVLRDLNLTVNPGETIAIVGISGIGKTTLCSLIPRFYEVSGGEIRIDSASIRNVTQSSLRRQIGVVSQTNFLFSGTVYDNILYGKPNATPEEVEKAAKKADAHDFIMNLPNGYHTEIGEKGVKLSGGQKQRISIARVILKDPPILIFDEATSALDNESERAVMSSMRELAKGKTTFIIAHRLSTVQNSDRIVVVANGGVEEQGTHDELLQSGKTYASLYNSLEIN